MKAQIIKAFGDAKIFTSAEIAKPILRAGQVIIRVIATSVNPLDCKIRAGDVPEISPALPAVLHGDVVGEVVEIADDVKSLRVGEHVYGWAGGVKGLSGALAEFMQVDARLVAKCSTKLSQRENAALPLVTITAWLALFERLKLAPKQHILIHGGVGGVGHIAVQLAKWAGAKIATTVADDSQIELAKSFGADEVINFKKETVADYVKRLTNDQGFPMIFDTVGGPNLLASFTAAAFNGSVVTTAARANLDLSLMHNKGLNLHVIFTLLPLLHDQNREQYSEILTKATQLVEQGKLKPFVDPQQFNISQITAAHEYLESGKARGKVVVEL